MSYVLAIEPHLGQARILCENVASRARTKLTVVESATAAMTAIDREVPSLVLLSALIPPQDESDLLARLQNLPNATAPQVLFIPALAPPETSHPRRSLIDRVRSRYRWPTGCDPSAFGDQLSVYLRDRQESYASVTAPLEPTEDDRRAAVRLLSLASARLLIDGAQVDMADLSLTGAQIVSPMVLQPGRSVQVMLSSGTDAVRCHAGVVWSGFEIVGPTQTPSVRAGITFTHADRRALQRFCAEHIQPGALRLVGSERKRDATELFSVTAGDVQATVTAPQDASSMVRRPADRQRPRAVRQDGRDVSWLSHVTLPWGLDTRLLNISSTGLLLESGSKVAPGSVTLLQLCGPEWQITIPACFVRSVVAQVNGLGVKYHLAAAFKERLEFPTPHPTSRQPVLFPERTLRDPTTNERASMPVLCHREP